ncbi:MAG TPA: hypothetical protein VFK05_14195 [Polyangiaceae bacterium]|nr:hypothetical protein [Polyangiaceae bacterium]
MTTWPWASRPLFALLFLGASLSATSLAQATERHFTYTYESGVLAPGHVELEPWTTVRVGRDDFYSRIENRLEFELGLTERLQTSLYLNTAATAQDSNEGGVTTRQQSFELSSISSEWKLKLSDPTAHPLGSALYFEGSYGNSEAELEAKVILDKRIGNLVLATNLVGELEFEFAEPGETEKEAAFELDLGAAYFITRSVTLGAELRPTMVLAEGELESVAFYGGPTLSTAYDGWWTALTVLPQLYSPKNEQGRKLDLAHNERVQIRVLLGMHL